MAFKKRTLRAYWASLMYQRRRKRFWGDDDPPPPPINSVFTDEFTAEFEGRPEVSARELIGKFFLEFA